MNTYKKYCPNVFVAKCDKDHEKGEIITLTTKYGKDHECEVYNFLGKTKDGEFLYSITREDGFNAQERAQRKADRLNGYAINAEKRSQTAYEKADMSEAKTGIPFGQPILVGHHSENRHRKTLERADNAMRKSIEEDKKAAEYRRRSAYWERMASKINLSMPESLEYFEFKLEEAKKEHQFLKENPNKRPHMYALTYAKKAVNEAEKNLQTAVKLWGSEEAVQKINDQKKEEAEKKAAKSTKQNAKIDELGGFFAFNKEQFQEGYAKILAAGKLKEGEKVTHIKAGLYLPSKNVQVFLNN